MTTLATNQLTLLDVSKRLDPNGQAATIAELLAQDNEILMDIPWIEGNLPTGHRVTVRTGMPTLAWRKLNAGVAQSKSTTAQIDEACGMLEGFGQVDIDLAMLNGNTAAFRLQENAAFIEQMNQEMATTLFYGDTAVNPERFLGLSPRFDDVPTTSGGAANKVNVIDAGGSSTDNMSIWLIGWGPNTVHGIYPKGSDAGLIHEDLGKQLVLDGSNNKYLAWCDRYQWKCGMALRDWRYVVRIANIPLSTLTKTGSTGADLTDLMTRALEKIHSLSGVTPRFYVNRTIRSFLRRQIVNKVASSTLTMADLAGKPTMMFGEVPVRRTDALLETEARVT